MKFTWSGIASFRRRILFRSVFLLLGLATVALTIMLLQVEKRRGYQNYQQGFDKTKAEIAARLNHPAGQLALINAARSSGPVTPLRPYVLPYAALDFDDANKVQQAVETAGCLVQYKDYSAVCAAVGNNPWAGGFIYLAGRFASGPLASRTKGERNLEGVHRVRVTLTMRGETERWIAPFERMETPPANRMTSENAATVRGRLTGFVDSGDGGTTLGLVKPVRDFRGWLWQSGQCIDGSRAVENLIDSGCKRGSFYSIRLPVALFQEALFQKSGVVWPPADLDQIRVRIEVIGPVSEGVIFDSNSEAAAAPFALADLKSSLLPGETLVIRKLGKTAQTIATIKGASDSSEPAAPWVERLLLRLPLGEFDAPLASTERISTSNAAYEAVLTGDVRGLNKSLATVATRMSWFIGAMLAAIALAWLVIEVGLIRRITVLNRRARGVSKSVQGNKGLVDFDLADLRGKDELGTLAGALHDLLQRVNEDVQREQIRAEQEKDMLHAVGHEIVSPLQSLMVLHGQPNDPSARYVQRMQQAIRVLYGSASPSEALQSTQVNVAAINLNEFLKHVADNASAIDIHNVRFITDDETVQASADEYSLEDVITHILQNAQRYRRPDSEITIALTATDAQATITITNIGPTIDGALIDKIFEYGVSGADVTTGNAAHAGNRGQGLYVAKTYMAKMGGTITASNTTDGVCFVLTLVRA